MMCIRTVSYYILINQQQYGKIMSTRGIQQGDPLSLYFFILYTKGLSTLLNKAEWEGRIIGLPIS